MWLADYRQWERYRAALGDKVPKTFRSFLKHKLADDEKYKTWLNEYRFARKTESFSAIAGTVTANGIQITGISKHAIERAISRKFSAEEVLETLKNPKKIGKIKID